MIFSLKILKITSQDVILELASSIYLFHSRINKSAFCVHSNGRAAL